MYKVVIVKNPFDPARDRTIKFLDEQKTLQEIVDLAPKQVEFKVTVNGKLTDDLTVKAKDNDFIVLIPKIGKGGKGGKGLLGIVAMVALSAASFGVGSMVAASVGSWGIAAYSASAAVMFLGGALISHFTPKQTLKSEQNDNESQTYSWNGTSVMEGQNNPIPIVYGKVKTSGQSIGRYVETNGDKEYLNWLLAAGYGPLEISDIKINDNPIGNYKGVSVETRSGTNDQSVISNFNDTYFTKQLGYKLSETAQTEEVQGDSTQGIRVTLEWPNGLYHVNKKGKVESAWMDVEILYMIEGGSWQTLYSGRVTASQYSTIRRSWTKTGLTSGKYSVSCRITGRQYSESDAQSGGKCYWTGLTSIITDDFAYPNVALVGIKALATDQLSGTPSISFIVNRPYVWVWNPHTSAYEQKAANNPAWAAYDYVHQCSRLMNINTGSYEFEVRGADKNLMLYDQFAGWAAFCDEKDLHINWIDDTMGRFMDKVNEDIAPIGRGYVLWYGTKCGCVWDAVKEPVQMFGMGNIIEGSFKEDFLQTEDRANCIELTYCDAEKDYERNTITVYGDDYDKANTLQKTTQVTYDGITSYEQAVRTAKYLLYCNEYLIRTVTFEADIDSIACQIGDVITVAHDVPRWAYSGRIYQVNGNQLVLPVEAEEPTEQYRIMYRTQDDTLHEKQITWVSSEDGYTIVDVTDGFDDGETPEAGDVFDLAYVTKGSKPFTVRSITRAQDFTRKIEAIEYNENIYNENYDIPAIDSSMDTPEPQNVIQLQGRQIAFVDGYGQMRSRLYASWNLPEGAYPCKYNVYLSTNNEEWTLYKQGISSQSTQLDVETDTEYYIKVISVLGVMQSTGTTYGPIAPGVDNPPPDVANLSCEAMADGTRRFWWDYDYPDPNDVAGFKIRYVPNGTAGWSKALPLNDGLITSSPFETNMLRQGKATVLIKAVDNAGNESENAAVMTINLGDPIAENVLYKNDLTEDGWSKVTHNGYVDPTSNILYSVSSTDMWTGETDSMWTGESSYMWESSFDELEVSYTMTAPASGNLWMDIQATGITAVYYTVNGVQFPYTQRVTVKAGDEIAVLIEGSSGKVSTQLKVATIYIDVPDVTKRFENVEIPVEGIDLPIDLDNAYTTSVAVTNLVLATDSGNNMGISYNHGAAPCHVQITSDYGSTKGVYSGTADIVWQGYVKETLE